MSHRALAVFDTKEIRRVWHKEEWWFVLVDVVAALTDSVDPAGYVKDMRRRDEELSEGWGQIATPLSVTTSGGPQQMNCSNTEGLFRIIQSIPSKKAEPFKLWLAKTGYERIQEIENPELAQDRAKGYYEAKGYPKAWIEKRLRGIAVRQELTDEWKSREVTQETEFAILTNEISKATFGKTVGEYKDFKGIERTKNNLRDHMTDWELILTMVGEKATTDITAAMDAKGLEECKITAKEGGEIAHLTRTAIEKKTGKSLVSKKNFLHLTENDATLTVKKRPVLLGKRKQNRESVV